MTSGGHGRATASASKSRHLKRKKNSPGSRRDPGWDYAKDINGDSKKTKCKVCSKLFSGGIFRFKHHLARTKENVELCLSVPDDVRKQMLDILDLNLEAKERASGSSSVPPTCTQTTISTLLKKDLRKDATKSIARWFYLTGTPFNAAREPEYYTMFELDARHGPGFKPSSYHEIRETLLKEELEEVKAKLSILKNEWISWMHHNVRWLDRQETKIDL
ncbi:hypothetical protein LINPERPRIM_LOCUS30557 [Linum perenne]